MDKNTISEMEKESSDMWNMAKTIEPDMTGGKPTDSGKFVKHYQYDAYNQVYVELYENGALFVYVPTGRNEWYYNKQLAFNKAKMLGGRAKNLNKMFGF
jgi:hypothetical protein